MAIKHRYITVDSDERKKADFEGNLADFAAEKLNKFLDENARGARVINIESSTWRDDIRPSQCDSSTWYQRTSFRLSVWYEAAGDPFVPA